MREPINESRTVPGPMTDVSFAEIRLNPNPRIRNPRSGKTGINVMIRFKVMNFGIGY